MTMLAACLMDHARAQTSSTVSNASIRESTTLSAGAETVTLPQSVPDPIEPFNRLMWSFNRGLMTGLVKPTARVYRFFVIKPVRTAIGHFGKNITYPGRLINNLLQGKWGGASDETRRFFANTVVGMGGVMDVATRWKIPASDADFGQTFGQWGWNPGCYLMLPILGPSNERDLVGLAVDSAANPLTYLSFYPFNPHNPLTYMSPYTYLTHGVLYNGLSDTVDDTVRFIDSEKDAYANIQYAWTFARENRVADFKVKGEQDPASLETLQSVFFTFKDREFPNRGKTRSALIPATGKKLKVTFWLQPQKSAMVYIVPGLGSHRLAEASLALAELVYKQGYSVACLSSPYNHEFMEHASTAAMPAYTPVDARDLHGALTEIDHLLEALHPGLIGSRVLMGYSMGAFQSLFVAGTESTNQPPLLAFDRYIAINPPVRLLHGVSKLDEFYEAPLAWPAGERTAHIENAFLKVAALSKSSLAPQTTLPFDAVESKFLIGLAFRLILRDILLSSQQRDNQGILGQPITPFRRASLHKEILKFSYKDYFEKFAAPYYSKRGIDLTSAEVMRKANDLRTYGAALQGNQRIRLILNRNDFLLADEDLKWLEKTFKPEQLAVFDQGGHLGSLAHPAVQKAIAAALEGLESRPSN